MVKKRSAVGVALLLVGLLLGCGGGGSVNGTTAVVVPPASGPGDFGQAMQFGGLARTYYLHIPATYAAGKSLPLVIMLHGRGGTGLNASGYMGMNRVADQEGFIVVYPDGTDQRSDSSFNASWCCGYAQANGLDDVGFISALIDEMHQRYNVNLKMVYASGLSNGAMMAYYLGVRLADRLAAVAPVAGTIRGDEAPPTHPLSLVVFHGDADDNVRYAGVSNKADGYRYNSVAENQAFWVQADGCQPTPQVAQSEGGSKQTFSGCKAGTEVVYYTVKGGPHTWFEDGSVRALPGRPGDEQSLAQLIWHFFKAHAKQ